MSLELYCGLMNSGKTLVMCNDGYEEFLRGKKIYSNFHLNFPHTLINRDYIFYLGEKQPSLENSCFLLDELWIWLDCRDSQANKIATYFFLQSSKDDSNIKITAQDFGQNDRRIKQNFHSLSMCSRVLKINNTYVNFTYSKRRLPPVLQDYLYIKELKYIQHMSITNNLRIDKIRYIKAKPLFKLYDTGEKIRMK